MDKIERVKKGLKRDFGLISVTINDYSNTLDNERIFIYKLKKTLEDFTEEQKDLAFTLLKNIRFELDENLQNFKATGSSFKLPWNFDEEAVKGELQNMIK